MTLPKSTITVCCALLLWLPDRGTAQEDARQAGQTVGIVAVKPDAGPCVQTEAGFMVPYKATLPGTDVVFEMVPVPGGTFQLGSPQSEEGRVDDEGPQVTVRVAPFWIGKYEVTWEEYKQYMNLQEAFQRFRSAGIREVTEANQIDAVTSPSSLYDPSFTYDAGDEPRQPAATMTQYAAKQYTKWLSIVSGGFYRLPSESEWEYACRAGSSSAYSFGDDPSELEEYAWFDDNADYERHDVGLKKPNAWGLYDMHGNVAEWVLDQYSEDGYSRLNTGKPIEAEAAVNWPSRAYPVVARGGSWEMLAEQCRSASRLASDDNDWKAEDPNVPKSPWWYTTEPSTGVGFRIVRPLHVPSSRAERERYWGPGVKMISDAVNFRINDEGRGARGLVDPGLPEAIKALDDGR